MDGELPLVFRGGAWYLCVLCPTRQRLALVVVRRPELQHGPRQVPVGQNLRNGGGTRLLAQCTTAEIAQPIPIECTVEPACKVKVHGCKVFSDVRSIFSWPQ